MNLIRMNTQKSRFLIYTCYVKKERKRSDVLQIRSATEMGKEILSVKSLGKTIYFLRKINNTDRSWAFHRFVLSSTAQYLSRS